MKHKAQGNGKGTMEVSPNIEQPNAQIIVGHYAIRPFDGDSIWLENEGGEGMQIWTNEFEKVLDKYWKEYF